MNTQQKTQHNPFIHFSWRTSMSLRSLWKGMALVAVLLLIASEAFAQLPVRTQRLELISPSNAARFSQTFTGAAATDIYTLAWPESHTQLTDASSGYLRVTRTGTTLSGTWVEISGSLVDGTGAAGQVAYWSDPNTLTGDAGFTYAGGGTVTIGTGGSGTVNVVGAGGVTLDGAAGTVEFGNVTLGAGGAVAGTIVNMDAVGSAGTYYITPSDNQAGAGTTNYIYVSNGDGTASWVANPTTNFNYGVTAGNGTYTQSITVTGMPATATVVVSTVGTDANIIQVTAIAAGSFTVQSTAPLDGSIAWMVNW